MFLSYNMIRKIGGGGDRERDLQEKKCTVILQQFIQIICCALDLVVKVYIGSYSVFCSNGSSIIIMVSFLSQCHLFRIAQSHVHERHPKFFYSKMGGLFGRLNRKKNPDAVS